MYLKATVRPDLKPDDPYDKRQLPDENAWVYEEYTTLVDKFSEAIKPLDGYMATYNKYSNEYKLDPDQVIKKLDDNDNPPEIDFLKKDVKFHQDEALRLK